MITYQGHHWLWPKLVISFFVVVLSVTAQAIAPIDSKVINRSEELQRQINDLLESNLELQHQQTLQAEQLSYIVAEKNNIISQITHVQNTLSMLIQQGEWLSFSTALGETLRRQLLNLPAKPKSQQLEQDIADIRAQQFNYQQRLELIDKRPSVINPLASTAKGAEYRKLIRHHQDLLKELITGDDNLVLELTRLKIANNQLIEVIDEVNDAAHRYLFWVADVKPIDQHYLFAVFSDLSHVIFSLDTTHQLLSALSFTLSIPSTVILILISLIFVGLQIRFRTNFYHYLSDTAMRIGKVTQDNFRFTLIVFIYSILMALPLPVLWGAIGYALKTAWNYPIAVAIGHGVNAAAPILWVFMISAYFARPNGLFIAHFKWPLAGVRTAMKYYRLSIWVVIPLVMILMGFDTYEGRQFSGTIGRFSFILLCLALIFMTNAIHRSGVPMYIDKKGSGDNLLSRILWMILLSAPWIAVIAACLGYLLTSQILLGRLEASVAIWFGLLVIYFMIRRWMWIQKRKIEFDRAKQRRIERLAQRTRSDEDIINDIIEEPVVDLDTISSQSLQLVRSILVMIALISMILLWSEMYSAFAFMDNIKLWTTKTLAPNGTEIDESITLASVFISVLVLTITVQLVKNLPALLELGILQHLELGPGTGYAISTLSKYLILMIGCMIAFSFIGIDWSKIQWLIAALGVGLGFGLQEIFANFISGLIILFEKPIRIGDTVTIRDLTGAITKINTRATTIVDWDRKEIVMPNKAFITEQLVNWSLSDAITRIVLTVPATIDADSNKVIHILKQAAKDCSYVLADPEPQVFLVDIQEGIQLFEIRVFAAEMSHRMPLRSEIHQLILKGYHEHHLELPFPPLQTNFNALGRKSGRHIYQFGTV